MQYPPGVGWVFTPDAGTGSGACTGTDPESCVAAPCTFTTAKIRVVNAHAGGPIIVSQGNVELLEHDAANFKLATNAPSGSENLDCTEYPSLDLFTVRHPNGTNYAFSLLCTACPEYHPPY